MGTLVPLLSPRMFFLPLLLPLLALSLGSPLQLEEGLQWARFKHQHDKEYRSIGEEAIRLEVFRANLAKMSSHNLREEAGLETWRMAVTQWMDLTEQEFKDTVLGGY